MIAPSSSRSSGRMNPSLTSPSTRPLSRPQKRCVEPPRLGSKGRSHHWQAAGMLMPTSWFHIGLAHATGGPATAAERTCSCHSSAGMVRTEYVGGYGQPDRRTPLKGCVRVRPVNSVRIALADRAGHVRGCPVSVRVSNHGTTQIRSPHFPIRPAARRAFAARLNAFCLASALSLPEIEPW